MSKLYESRQEALEDRCDLIAILWLLARPGEVWGNGSDIEAVLAKRRARLRDGADMSDRRTAGRPAKKLQEVVERIRAEIQANIITREELEALPIKQLSHRFDGHHETAARAREVVLADDYPHEQGNAASGGNAVIEFPHPKTDDGSAA
jgi:hypothetical protein